MYALAGSETPARPGMALRGQVRPVPVRILSENRVGRTDRVHRMDTGWALETLKILQTKRR
jgi:hypothetical protein